MSRSPVPLHTSTSTEEDEPASVSVPASASASGGAEEIRPRLTRNPDCHATALAHRPISVLPVAQLNELQPPNEERPRKAVP
jgi:hypothetical protein